MLTNEVLYGTLAFVDAIGPIAGHKNGLLRRKANILSAGSFLSQTPFITEFAF